MATVTQPLDRNVVATFRGVVDFYYWKGLACARAWPRPAKQPGTPAQRATWTALKDVHVWIRTNPPAWKALWTATPMPPTMSAEDARRKTGLALAYAHALHRPPVPTAIVCAYNPGPDTTTITITVQLYTLYDPAHTAWMIRPYTATPPPLEWFMRGYCITRQRAFTQLYDPVLSGYVKPIATTWNPPTSSFDLTTPGNIAHAAAYPTPPTPDNPALMLGAPFA